MTTRRPVITQQPGEEIPAEILAKHIEKLAEVGKQFQGSRLKQRTVIILISRMTKVPEKYIKSILDALPLLADEFLKP